VPLALAAGQRDATAGGAAVGEKADAPRVVVRLVVLGAGDAELESLGQRHGLPLEIEIGIGARIDVEILLCTLDDRLRPRGAQRGRQFAARRIDARTGQTLRHRNRHRRRRDADEQNHGQHFKQGKAARVVGARDKWSAGRNERACGHQSCLALLVPLRSSLHPEYAHCQLPTSWL
jgi:hypothetical protein